MSKKGVYMAENKDTNVKKSRLDRILDAIERAGNKLPDPITLFLYLAVIVVLISWLCSYTNEGRHAIREPRRNIRPSERWNSFFHETIGHNSRLLVFRSVIAIYRWLGWME